MIEFWEERYKNEDYLYGIHPNRFFRLLFKMFIPGEYYCLLKEREEMKYMLPIKDGKSMLLTSTLMQGKKAHKLALKARVSIDYFIGDMEFH